jgi:hypothetical protein
MKTGEFREKDSYTVFGSSLRQIKKKEEKKGPNGLRRYGCLWHQHHFR